MLKSKSGWKSNGNGEDAFGFSALPAGQALNNLNFSYGGGYTRFWSSTKYNNNDAYDMFLNYDYEGADLGNYSKYMGYSVRCIKD